MGRKKAMIVEVSSYISFKEWLQHLIDGEVEDQYRGGGGPRMPGGGPPRIGGAP